jgi:hypothetical protein
LFEKMGLIEQAISDVRAITAGAFGVSITMTALNGEVATFTGLHTKHHLSVDAEGREVSSKKASIAIHEQNLSAANASYPIRNADGEVVLLNHKVSVPDSTGSAKNYIVLISLPDEALGLIVLILGDYEA